MPIVPGQDPGQVPGSARNSKCLAYTLTAVSKAASRRFIVDYNCKRAVCLSPKPKISPVNFPHEPAWPSRADGGNAAQYDAPLTPLRHPCEHESARKLQVPDAPCTATKKAQKLLFTQSRHAEHLDASKCHAPDKAPRQTLEKVRHTVGARAPNLAETMPPPCWLQGCSWVSTPIRTDRRPALSSWIHSPFAILACWSLIAGYTLFLPFDYPDRLVSFLLFACDTAATPS